MKGGGLKEMVSYSNPSTVEIGLIEAGDDLFDEVASGTEMASLPQQQGRFGIADCWTNIQDRFQVTVYPVVSRHSFSLPHKNPKTKQKMEN